MAPAGVFVPLRALALVLNGAKQAFERGVIKKCAMIVSYERTGFFSSNSRHSYKNV